MTEHKYRDPLLAMVEFAGNPDLPRGYDSWGMKSTDAAGYTKYGFRWPNPGEETERLRLLDHSSSCPREVGDGLCVATTYQAMASGGYRALALLLVAYRSHEARGSTRDKFRVPQVAVVARLDGEKFLQACGSGLDLSYADLSGFYLPGVNLSKSNLVGAHLGRAYLSDADMSGANLVDINLSRAVLSTANMKGSNLRAADLGGANMHGADLREANLDSTYLFGASLHGAKLPEGWDISRARSAGAIIER